MAKDAFMKTFSGARTRASATALCAVALFVLAGAVRGADPQPATSASHPRDYRFDGKNSCEVLENYLSRSVSFTELALEVPADSVLAKRGLQKGDVILSVNGSKTADAGALLQQAQAGRPPKHGYGRFAAAEGNYPQHQAMSA